jgi:predicted component of type VI protein secretion system
MMLTLAMVRGPANVPPQRRSLTGGTFAIGRGPENDWVLPDPERVLSKRHCVLAWRQGLLQLADMSSNGTFINDAAEPLGLGQIYTLRDGDRLRLGPYEVVLRLQEQPAPPAPTPVNPFSEDSGQQESTVLAVPPSGAPAMAPAPPPARLAPVSTDTALFQAFLRGAKLPPAVPEDAQASMERLGAAFRAAVVGIRHTLSARTAVKDEFRIEQTMIRARGNNPLKFAASDDDATATLAGVGRRTEMPAAAAMTDALRDIHLHEIATMAAMQTAVRALLRQLDPAPLREEAERSGGLLPAQRRARAFELYEKRYDDIRNALSDDFDRVFGRAFAEAYAEAMQAASDRGRA